jgi:hypothetical protein
VSAECATHTHRKRRFAYGAMLSAYLFDFRRINIYFLFCRTNSVRDLIFV